MRRLLLLVLVVGVSWLPGSATTDSYIELCLPEVGILIQRANASFTAVVDFAVDSSGHPTAVRIRDGGSEGWPPIDSDQLSRCVRSWRLGGLAEGTRLSATWKWIHARGWDYLQIEGPGFNQRIVLNGAHCYYCPKDAAPSNLRLDPAVEPVTGLANGARPAPGPPAGQADR